MSADPLVIDGMRAVELARLTQGMTGWPGLHRYQNRAHPERVERVRVQLAAAEADLAAGWGVGAYAYPVPRERVESELAEHERALNSTPNAVWPGWMDAIRAALRGSDEAIYTVACALARRDRDELRAN